MKIIEALKKKKDLLRKAEDIRGKIKTYCADLDFEIPVYKTETDQRAQVKEWIQAHFDILKEISSLSLAITRTNISTQVTIELGGKQVKKSIAEWVIRRQSLIKLDQAAWAALTDRGLKPGHYQKTSGVNENFQVRRYYDQKERDVQMDLLNAEPSLIDSALEIANAVSDLIE